MLEHDISITLKALRQNGMEAEYLDTYDALLRRLTELLPPGATIASGSSETLTTSGIRHLLNGGEYTYFDAGDPALSPEERDLAIRKAFDADVYLTSVAAVTKTGELLLVDGTGNRVAAMSYGPKRVIVIVGRQKIVEDMDAALQRLQTIAAPQNALRRGKKELPCAKRGKCMSCKHPLRMCCYYLRVGFTRAVGRIRVLIVGQEVGY